MREDLDDTIHRLEDALHKCWSNKDIVRTFGDLLEGALLLEFFNFISQDWFVPHLFRSTETAISDLQKQLCIALEDNINLGLVRWMLVADWSMVFVHPLHCMSHTCFTNHSLTPESHTTYSITELSPAQRYPVWC
jgi:hypothetical protein